MRIKIETLLLSIIASAVLAQNQPSFEDRLAPRRFYIDYSVFQDSLSDSVIVDVYYKAYSSALSYEKWGDKFRASYEISVVFNHKGKQVTGITREGDLFADNYKMTLSREDFVIDVFSFMLIPDNYELVGRLVDAYSGDELIVKRNVRIKDFGRKTPYLSTIEFVRESQHSDDKSRFVRDGMRIIPSVSRAFGYSEPEMLVYYQIYNKEDFDGDYLVYYDMILENRVIMSDTSLFPSSGAVTGRLEEFNVESLLPGVYSLAVRVKSPGRKLKVEAETDFTIEWSIMGIVRNDFKTAVEQLRYIATRDEMDKLKDAPETDRIKLWNDFWELNDPSPSTAENELRNEYYKRVRYADLNFGHFGKDGWKTDMGMVYIKYGSPDEIERHPFDIDTKPYQIWYYYEQKRRFVFVDFNGYGEYELQYPYDGDLRRVR